MNGKKAHKFIPPSPVFLVTMQHFLCRGEALPACSADNMAKKRRPPTAVGGRRVHFLRCGDAKRGRQKCPGTYAVGRRLPGAPCGVPGGALHRRRDAGEREQEDGSGDGKRHKDLFLNPFEHGGPPPFLHAASAAPSARQLLSAASSGASWVMTLSAASTAPAAVQSASQLRIHSPSPQP